MFTKELFLSTINALEQQYTIDIENVKSIEKVYKGFCDCYDNHRLTNKLLEILQTFFPPKDGDCRIEYFMYELDFGRRWEPGKVTINGVDVPLKTSEELYSLLTGTA